MNKIVFEDQIILYWDKEWDLANGIEYTILLDGKEVGKTVKTHFTFENLQSDKEYKLAVYRLGDNDEKVYLFDQAVRTPKAKNRIDVSKPPYNAVGDGKTLNTKAIQKAMDDCTESDCVYIPSGVFMTGALDMHSNMELYVDKGGVLQGTAQVKDYTPKIWSRFEGEEMECYRSLLNIGKLDHTAGYTTQNIVIRGKGAILGGGVELCNAVRELETELLKDFLENNKELVASCERPDTIPKRRRGRLLNISNCKNVIVHGLEIGMGPSWNIHFIYSKDVITCGCYIRSQGVSNGDGWDPDSSEDCVCFNNDFATHDDGIAIKSGKNPEGNKINRPTKNIRVFDCRGRNSVAIGSELSGGIENVYVWDCDYQESNLGVNIKTTTKRGGYVKNVKVKDCRFVGIGIRTKYGCNNDGESSGCLTEIENIYFQDIYFYGRKPEHIICPADYRIPIYFEGFDGDGNEIKNVTVKNCVLEKRPDGKTQDIYIKNVKGLTLENVKFQ